MVITIDRAGRVVIPQAIRRRLGLDAGTELSVDEVDGGVVLRPKSKVRIVAALSDWHPLQDVCRSRLTQVEWLPAHAITETIVVMSRMPKGLAVPVEAAVGAVRGICAKARHVSADLYLPVLDAVGRAGLSGGAVYDAIIGATAREHGVTLLTLDRRARRTYQVVGARFELLG